MLILGVLCTVFACPWPDIPKIISRSKEMSYENFTAQPRIMHVCIAWFVRTFVFSSWACNLAVNLSAFTFQLLAADWCRFLTAAVLATARTRLRMRIIALRGVLWTHKQAKNGWSRHHNGSQRSSREEHLASGSTPLQLDKPSPAH